MYRARSMALVATLVTMIALLLQAGPASASYPGTNGRIGFGSDRSGDTHNIFTMASDGSDVRQLTHLTADQGAALRESWSADGSKLAFEQRNTDGTIRQIFVMNADGSGQHQLFHDGSFLDFDPSFSPDGSTIVFSRCRANIHRQGAGRNDPAGWCAIFKVRASDGGALTAITLPTPGVFDHHPEYSPNGRRIAFTSFERDGVGAASYVMNADGSNIHRVTDDGQFDPDWSPNGSRIAFSSLCCDPETSTINTAKADGTDPVQLTSPGGADSADFSPVYSPAGDKVAFERDFSDGSFRVYVIAATGGTPTLLQDDAFLPAWGSSP